MKSENMVRRPVDRRGIVLILALGMLALFTVVAITLASISRTQATAAGNFKRLEQYGSNTLTVRPDEVNDLFRYALNQLVYDTRNRQSAIRGHSLLRDMYGSPTTYSMTYGTGGAIQSLTSIGNNNGIGDGAELRLKKSDLLKLLNITTNTDPRLMALDYQKVYNGTGLFPPRKIDFTGATFVPGTGVTGFENLYLSNREIASQYAFMNVPGRLMPTTPSFYPSNNADWKSVLLNPFGAVPTGAAYWLPLFPINYTEFDAFSPNGAAITRLATGASIDPERFTYVSSILGTPRNYPQGDHWFGADEDYDYPDVNNMFLAMERADGKMLIPSFHRPGIIAQVADGVNTLTGYGAAGEYIGKLPWLPYNSGATSGNPPADFHGLVLRPRAADRDPRTLGISSPRSGRFREMADVYNGVVRPATGSPVPGQDGLPDDLDGSGFIGDHPTELDVDTDGDGQNDSVWVDIGAPVIQVGDSAVKPLFAFKVIGMDGKINLNTAGNLYKTPIPDMANKGYNWSPAPNPPVNPLSINYTLLHKSNLGASPTEINPQYAMILGDNGGPAIWAMGNLRPPTPIWGFNAGGSAISDPYLRLIEGYTNLYTGDQAAGRWTGSTGNLPGISSSDDNGNLTNPNNLNPSVTPTPAQLESFDTSLGGKATPANMTNNYDYSNGNGLSPDKTIAALTNPLTAPAGTPAVHGLLSPIDFYGLGTKYSPLSYSAVTHAAQFGLYAGGGNLLPAYLNYAEIAGTTFGAKLQSLDDGSKPLTPPIVPQVGGLSVLRVLANEPTETNVYNPSDDSLYTAADIATLLRANDFDSSANQSRFVNLLPDQMGRRSVDISAGATLASPSFYSPESYGRRRMQNLFTHESWDLIRYSAPPTFHSSSGSAGEGLGLFLGPTVAGSPGEVLDISGDTGNFANNPVEGYLARSHSGGGVPNFIAQLLSYKLPTNTGGNVVAPVGSSPYAKVRDIYEQLALTKTTRGDDFLIPYEVQMGRRLDLNRPLTAYKKLNASNSADIDDERESFAQQIYVLLSLASGACGPDPSGKVLSPQARWARSRALAQIAVNIVDYIDPDTVMTRMRFDPDLSDGWDISKATLDNPLTGTPLESDVDIIKSITTVIGFELPQLVINESLAIIAEDVVTSVTPNETDEILLNWVELFNPWPDAIDPVDEANGLALYDTTNNESIFMLQMNRLDSTDPDVFNTGSKGLLLPIAITSPTLKQRQLVTFSADGMPAGRSSVTSSTVDGDSKTSGAKPRVFGQGSGKEFFVIGPPDITKVLDQTKINPVIPQSISNDYTASAFAYDVVNTQATNATVVPQIDIRLYRKRNPFRPHHVDDNPYIVIDSVSQQYQQRPLAHYYRERTSSTLENEKQPANADTGLYFVRDTSPEAATSGVSLPSWVAAPATSVSSYQRRQPWHGYNADWRPYLGKSYSGGSLHPFIGNILGYSGKKNLEGAFYGLPSLTEITLSIPKSVTPSIPNIADIQTDSDETNGLRQNGFIVDAASFGSANAKAYKKWFAFPFLNRQLATPLELLSLRLYGSHLWFRQGTGDIREWRLRFTDDFEFYPHAWRLNTPSMTGSEPYYERAWRSRQVPWFEDSRVTHPTFPQLPMATVSGIGSLTPPEVQLPLPHLYRFFELVECRSRMNNGLPANQQWVTISPPGWPADLTTALPTPKPGRSSIISPTVPVVPANILATQRAERSPGKINLNLITDEEVYRSLIDSIETAYYDLITDHLHNTTGNKVAYESGGNYTVAVSSNYWPINYWTSLFTPLGQAPLGNTTTSKALDVVDALGRMVPWSSLTLNNTTSITVCTPPLASGSAAVLSTGGFDIGACVLFGSGSGLVMSTLDLYSPPTSNYVMANSSVLSGLATFNIAGSPNRQFPGIVIGADPNYLLYPGTDPNRQVHSEMYRAFLLSRSGPDGIHGTADDKPFRSFASDDVSDTILRVRNSATNGLVKEGALSWDSTLGPPALVGVSPAEARSLVAKTYLDGSDDLVTMTSIGWSFYAGDYIARLGGQRAPGLFDPIPDPYSDYVSSSNKASIPHLLPLGADPNDASGDFVERLPTLDGAGIPQKLPADYWALEERRNELLAKISGNVTTRSHVFAVWVAVGFFRVEPGTEGLKVPLLGAEVGSESGKAFRHRAFFIIDRSQAKSYDPEDIDANFDFDIMRQKKLLEYYKIIE